MLHSVLGPSLLERHRGAGMSPGKGNGAGEVSGAQMLRGTGVV